MLPTWKLAEVSFVKLKSSINLGTVREDEMMRITKSFCGSIDLLTFKVCPTVQNKCTEQIKRSASVDSILNRAGSRRIKEGSTSLLVWMISTEHENVHITRLTKGGVSIVKLRKIFRFFFHEMPDRIATAFFFLWLLRWNEFSHGQGCRRPPAQQLSGITESERTMSTQYRGDHWDPYWQWCKDEVEGPINRPVSKSTMQN